MSGHLVYVIIVNWNLKEDTAECLHSVLQSDYPDVRVLVVDNGSTDGSPGHLRTLFPDIETIINPANLGFAKAINIGLDHALCQQADYVFLLNNDTTVAPPMLRTLVQTAQSDSQIGIVAPKILYYDRRDRIWHIGGRIRRWLPVPVTLGRNDPDDGRFSEPFEVDYVAFCGALIKRTVFQDIGLLDERFFFTYEDSDFCCRARGAGYRIISQPQAQMWHKVSLSVQRDRTNVRYLKSKSRAMFYRLHPHGPHPLLTAAWVLASTMITTAAHAVRGDLPTAQAALQGLYDGYREVLESS